MNQYLKFSWRTYTIVILSLILLPTGYFGIFYFQTMDGPISALTKKYSLERIDKTCQWQENYTYLACFKKDYYRFLRYGTPFERQLALKIQIKLFNADFYKHTTEVGKIHSLLDHLDLLNNFFLINKKIEMNIKKILN